MDLKRFLHWAGDNLGYSALKEVSCPLPVCWTRFQGTDSAGTSLCLPAGHS